MQFNVIEEKQNPLLKRKELLVSVDYEGKSTPSKAELQKALSKQFNANMENLEISKVLSETGLSRGKAWVKIWEEKKVPIYSEIKKTKKQPDEPKPEPKAKEEQPSEQKKEVKEEQKAKEPKEEAKTKIEEKQEPQVEQSGE